MGEMDEVIKEFLVESHENLDRLDRELVDLEKDPGNRDTLASIFRTFHTIKGTCGFLGYSKLEKLTHAAETLLGHLRDGRLKLKPVITTALLGSVDAVREILAAIEKKGNEGKGEYSKLVRKLTELGKEAGEDPQEVQQIGDILIDKGIADEKDVDHALAEQAKGDPRHIGEILVDQDKVSPQEVKEALEQQQIDAKSGSISESTIRVDVGQLDKLMNLVGELVLARNQVLQYTYSIEVQDSSFLATSQHLNLITAELEEGVMKTRMQPIGNVWSKFPRVVRDLAVACGKKVRIEMDGKDTELDKTIIEAIKDPLTHLVRNCVDHGIEDLAKRVEARKPASGVIKLRAYHEGGQVNIEISDDGGGIDPEKLKKKALSKNMITPDQAASMSDREAVHMAFLPGFSTAKVVSKVSGRGVGMDVVKTNIEKIGGTVDLQSQLGKGTTVKIKIPLTLAIIPALIVGGGGNRYAIPQISLLELVRLEGEQARKGVEEVQGASVYRLRGTLLPLVFLSRELGKDHEARSEEADGEIINIVVLQADDRHFGLVVENVFDTEEIVVKPVGKMLTGLSVFAGATIMGDGRVSLILDVMGLAQRADVVSEERDRSLVEMDGAAVEAVEEDREAALLFEIGKGARMALPLDLVARLEEIPQMLVERSGNQDVVQYRGEIMPLIHLSEAVPERRRATRDPQASTDTPVGEKEKIQVVVYSHEGRSVGLVVNRILDIAEEKMEIQNEATRAGVLGSLVMQEKVTELLDVKAVIQAVNVKNFERQIAAETDG